MMDAKGTRHKGPLGLPGRAFPALAATSAAIRTHQLWRMIHLGLVRHRWRDGHPATHLPDAIRAAGRLRATGREAAP